MIKIPEGKIQALHYGTPETVTISAASAASGAFPRDGIVRIQANCAIHYHINGAGTAATTSHTPLTAGQFEYRAVPGGDKVHAIQAAGTTGGTMYVEFIS